MSTRTKPFRRGVSQSAEIVPIKSAQMSQGSSRALVCTGQGGTASLLSIRQHLRYKACVAFSDEPHVGSRAPDQATRKIMATVRSLLGKEFGALRVHRHRQLLIVSHHCIEGLIGGLLRVQFISNQIKLPSITDANGDSAKRGISLSWGVGDSLFEAETARLRQTRIDLDSN